jgi:hypothetical protein
MALKKGVSDGSKHQIVKRHQHCPGGLANDYAVPAGLLQCSYALDERCRGRDGSHPGVDAYGKPGERCVEELDQRSSGLMDDRGTIRAWRRGFKDHSVEQYYCGGGDYCIGQLECDVCTDLIYMTRKSLIGVRTRNVSYHLSGSQKIFGSLTFPCISPAFLSLGRRVYYSLH